MTDDIKLGVNIDHVATLRQVRGTRYPDPVRAALLAEEAGADLITLHLREDRRHIQDRDVFELRGLLKTRMNLEAAITRDMLQIAVKVRPHDVCLVPERRMELTTEGGLDVVGQFDRVRDAVRLLSEAGIRVSLFISRDRQQIEAARAVGAPVIEIHTGHFADLNGDAALAELGMIRQGVALAVKLGLVVNAGHGLNYDNTAAVAAIAGISELNIGHAIVAESIFRGWRTAVRDMKALMLAAQRSGQS